jgi:hypothetical protein
VKGRHGAKGRQGEARDTKIKRLTKGGPRQGKALGTKNTLQAKNKLFEASQSRWAEMTHAKRSFEENYAWRASFPPNVIGWPAIKTISDYRSLPVFRTLILFFYRFSDMYNLKFT